MTGGATSAAIEIEVRRGQDALAELAADWDRLADRVDAVPFLRHGWMMRWWSAFGAGEPEIIVARRSGAVVGILPLARRGGAARAMSNVHSPLFDALAVDDAVAEELWRRALTPRRRLVEAVGLRAEPHGDGVLARAASAAGRRAWVRNEYEVPVIDLTATDWERYASSRGKSLRRTVRRHRGRLTEQAPLTLGPFTAVPPPSLLDEVFAVEASGWKGEAGSAIAQHETTRRFYGEVAAWLAANGWLRLMLLRHGGRLVAFELIVDHGSSWYPLKAGFDHDVAHHSPGVILQWDVLEAAFAAGVERYDYCGEAMAYASRWADDTVRVRRIDVFHPVLGIVDRAALAWARPLAKRVRDRVRPAARSAE